MANFDTLTHLTGPGTTRGLINALTLAATTETQFVMGTDTSGTTSLAVVTAPSGAGTNLVGSAAPLEFNLNSAISMGGIGRKGAVGSTQPFYSTTTFDFGRPFRIRVTGYATLNAGSGNSVVINIYQGTSTTIGSNSKIAALTAAGAPSTSFNFSLEAFVQWDSVSQVLSGYYTGVGANTLTAQHILSNASSVTTAAGLNFNITGTFGNAGGGTINISEFSIEQV